MAVKPGQLAEGAHRRHSQAGVFREGIVAEAVGELLRLISPAGVVPGDPGGGRAPVGSKKDNGLSHAGDALLPRLVPPAPRPAPHSIARIAASKRSLRIISAPVVSRLPRSRSVAPSKSPCRPVPTTAALVMVVPTLIPTNKSGKHS